MYPKSALSQWLPTGGDSGPQSHPSRHLAMPRDILAVSAVEGSATQIWYVGSRDTAKHPTNTRNSHTTKNYLIQKVKIAEDEKPCPILTQRSPHYDKVITFLV